MTAEEYLAISRQMGGRSSASPSSSTRPIAPPSDDPDLIHETVKGFVSGATGELADLAAHRVFGSDALDPDERSWYPYHAGYLAGALVGLPQRLGTWTLAQVGGRLIPKAGRLTQAAVANAAANAALGGISAYGQDQDVLRAMERGAVIGGALGLVGERLAPSVNKIVGRQAIPQYAKEATTGATKTADDASATLTEKTAGSSAQPPASPPPTESHTPQQKGPRSFSQARNEAYYRLHPEESPPPSYTILTPDNASAFRRIAEEDEILGNLFPKASQVRASASDPTDVPVPFGRYIEETISKELTERLSNDKFDFSDLLDFGQRYLSAKAKGIDPKAKDFPKHKTPFEKQIRDLVDKRYEEIADNWSKVYGIRATSSGQSKGPKLDPDILEAAPPMPKAKGGPTESTRVEPQDLWVVTPDGRVVPTYDTSRLPAVAAPHMRARGGEEIPPLRTDLSSPPKKPEVLQIPPPRYADAPSWEVTPDGNVIPPYNKRLGPWTVTPEGNVTPAYTVYPPPAVRAPLTPTYVPLDARASAIDVPFEEVPPVPPWALVPEIPQQAAKPIDLPPSLQSVEELGKKPPATKAKSASGEDAQVRKIIAGSDYFKNKVRNAVAKESGKSLSLTDKSRLWTKEEMVEQLKYEQREGTKEGGLAEHIEPLLQVVNEPDWLARLPKSTQDRALHLVRTWEEATKEFTPQQAAGVRLSEATQEVEKTIGRLKASGKSPEKIAIELAATLKGKLDFDMTASGSATEELGEGIVQGGDLAGLTITGREGGTPGGKSAAETVATIGRKIEELIGPEKASQLIGYVYSAKSKADILKNAKSIIGEPKKTPSDLKVASIVARARKQSNDDPDAVYLQVKEQYPHISYDQVASQLGIKAKPERAPKLFPRSQDAMRRIFSQDDEAI